MASPSQTAHQPAPPSSHGPVPCPHCGAVLDLTLPACAECGLRLRGEDAARLWHVDQEIAALTRERLHLITRLLPGGAGAAGTSYAPGQAQEPVSPPPRSAASPSGQQILLGLGAVLLLSAATFFGVVVWMVVGVWGQALMLTAMTSLAVAATGVATRRRLPAAAETGAVLASGLTLVGVWAAWSLDLGGLRDVSSTLYAAMAAVVVGGLALGYDRLVPRRGADGAPLREVLSYRPVATTSLSLAPWFLLAEVAPTGVGWVLGLGLVATSCAAVWWAAQRLDGRARVMLPPAFLTGLAALLYLLFGLAIAHDVAEATREWSALLILLTAAVAALTAVRLPLPGRVRDLVAVTVLPVAAVAAWSFTWEAHWTLLLVAAAAAAVAAVALAFAPALARRSDSWGHRCAQVVLAAVGAGLGVELLALHLGGNPALFGTQDGSGPGLAPVAAACAVWVAAGVVLAARLHSVLWLGWAHLALAATLAIALLDSGARAWTIAWLVAAVLLAAVAAVAARRPGAPRAGISWWDLVPSVFAAGFALVALASSSSLPHPWAAWTLIAVGVVAFAYSLLPGRLLVAYGAAPVISLGVGLHVAEAGWDAVEAFTWPLAALLAVVGWLHWRNDPAVHSRISMGPALGVVLLPSALVAVGEGDAVRLALTTAAGVVMLAAGLVRRLQAPVTVGAVALVLVAVTQGGPYVELLPGWLSLGVAGLILLTAGVLWERTVLAGRRAGVWFAELA